MKAVLSKNPCTFMRMEKEQIFNRKECAQDLVADGRKEEKINGMAESRTFPDEKDRPVGSDYIDALFTDFVEFHGDRYFCR